MRVFISALIRPFLRCERGAITVDYVVMGAATVGIGLSSAVAVRTGTGSLGQDIQTALTRAWVAGSAVQSFGFDNVEGLTRTGWGWRAWSSYDGWGAVSPTTAFEIVQSGYLGIHTPDGGNMLDLDASPGNLGIGRTLEDLVDGNTYTVTLNAADFRCNNGVDVFYGGALLGQIDPGASLQSYSFDFVAGSGDGSSELVIAGTGPADNYGAFIHGVNVR